MTIDVIDAMQKQNPVIVKLYRGDGYLIVTPNFEETT